SAITCGAGDSVGGGEVGGLQTLAVTTCISGGIVTNKGILNLQGTSFLRNGTLANTGTVNVQGSDTLDNEIVGNTGAGFIDVTGRSEERRGGKDSNAHGTNAATSGRGAAQ